VVTPPDNSSLYKSAEGYQKVLAHYDTTFQRIGIPYETKYVETRYGLTHTVISGNEHGKPIVLWHGLNANASTWASWISALASSYRVYAIDTIGGMGKSAPSRPLKKGSAYGHWAADALVSLGLKQVNMIGASNGGWIIGKLGSVAPEMIGCAVLMSSAGFMDLNILQALRMIPRVLFKPSAEAARGLATLLSPPNEPPAPFAIEIFELMLTSRFRSEQSATLLSDMELRQLTAPTYLLMGQYEVSFNPYKAMERGLNLLPNVIAAEIVPGVGHTMVHRQPDWVTSRVIDFLEQYAI
jgi:pimeloyl-ACP methyl ester carboxylesterase